MNDKLKTYTLKEVRAITGLGESTLYSYIRNGKLKTVKTGSRFHRVTESVLAEFTQNPKNEKTYTLQEVADTLSLNLRTLYRFIKTGRLIVPKVGWEYRVPESMLADFVANGIATDD